MNHDELRIKLYNSVREVTGLKPTDIISISALDESLEFNLYNGKTVFLKVIEEEKPDKEIDYEFEC